MNIGAIANFHLPGHTTVTAGGTIGSEAVWSTL
jgi:hypothetical protein